MGRIGGRWEARSLIKSTQYFFSRLFNSLQILYRFAFDNYKRLVFLNIGKSRYKARLVYGLRLLEYIFTGESYTQNNIALYKQLNTIEHEKNYSFSGCHRNRDFVRMEFESNQHLLLQRVPKLRGKGVHQTKV